MGTGGTGWRRGPDIRTTDATIHSTRAGCPGSKLDIAEQKFGWMTRAMNLAESDKLSGNWGLGQGILVCVWEFVLCHGAPFCLPQGRQ